MTQLLQQVPGLGAPAQAAAQAALPQVPGNPVIPPSLPNNLGGLIPPVQNAQGGPITPVPRPVPVTSQTLSGNQGPITGAVQVTPPAAQQAQVLGIPQAQASSGGVVAPGLDLNFDDATTDPDRAEEFGFVGSSVGQDPSVTQAPGLQDEGPTIQEKIKAALKAARDVQGASASQKKEATPPRPPQGRGTGVPSGASQVAGTAQAALAPGMSFGVPTLGQLISGRR